VLTELIAGFVAMVIPEAAELLIVAVNAVGSKGVLTFWPFALALISIIAEVRPKPKPWRRPNDQEA